MMQLRQSASVHSQLLASAEGQRDEYSKQISELRDQYSRISSKNQDVDPLVHEELKSKYASLEKEVQTRGDTIRSYVEKLTAKSEEHKKLKAQLADSSQKLGQCQTAEQDAQSKVQKQEQELHQLQNQLQEAKQQYQLLQGTHQQATSHMEKMILELNQKLAQSIHAPTPVAAVADPFDNGVAVGTSKAFSLASAALPPAAFTASAAASKRSQLSDSASSLVSCCSNCSSPRFQLKFCSRY